MINSVSTQFIIYDTVEGYPIYFIAHENFPKGMRHSNFTELNMYNVVYLPNRCNHYKPKKNETCLPDQKISKSCQIEALSRY